MTILTNLSPDTTIRFLTDIKISTYAYTEGINLPMCKKLKYAIFSFISIPEDILLKE